MKYDYRFGPHIFLLEVYCDGRERAFWICLPFFILKIIAPPQRI